MNTKIKQEGVSHFEGSGMCQRITLGDLREVMKSCEGIDDNAEIRFNTMIGEDHAALLDGTAVGIKAEYVPGIRPSSIWDGDELWLTIEGE